jgi:hypothetical protein
VVAGALARIAAQNGTLNAFTAVLEERALARADAIDRARKNGERLGPLAGAPFAVKNLFDIVGLPTTAGSKINRDRTPAPEDSPLIERLEAAGAVLVGALNMGEYAYDFTGENELQNRLMSAEKLATISYEVLGEPFRLVPARRGLAVLKYFQNRFEIAGRGFVIILASHASGLNVQPAQSDLHFTNRLGLR